MKNLIIGGIICVFIIDLIYKNCNKHKDETEKTNNVPQKEIDTNNEDNIVNENQNKEEESDNDDDLSTNKYNELLLQDEDDEFEGDIKLINKIKKEQNRKINLKIVYDPKRFSNHCETLSQYIKGNFTHNNNFHLQTQEFELPPAQNFKVQLITFSQLVITVFLFSFPSLKVFFTNIMSEKVFDRISSLRVFLIAGIFFIHQYFIRKYNSSYAFEVYVNKKLHFSAINNKRLPTFNEISHLLEEIYGLTRIGE